MVLKLASVEKFGARGLETEEITGFSNAPTTQQLSTRVLKEEEITGFSNRKGSFVLCYKYEEIAGHSNSRDSVRRTISGLEEDNITWYSNTCYTLKRNYRALKFGNTVLRRFGEG